MITNYYRDHDGWNGKTTLDIEDGRTLVIRTSKRSIGGGLATSVTAWRRNEDGSNRHVMGFGLGEGDYSERVTLSLGAAAWRSGDSMQALFDRADRALYAAKSAGRDRVAVEN